MSTWTPDRSKLEQVVSLLTTALRHDLDNAAHRQVQQEVDASCKVPEFNQYLAYVFAYAQADGASKEVRRMAGLLLRKSVEAGAGSGVFSVELLESVKAAVVAVLGDSDPLIRRAAGNLVSTIIRKIHLKNWRQVVRFCVSALAAEQNSPNPNLADSTLDGVFLVLANICEDLAAQIDADIEGFPLTILIPDWIKFTKHPNPNYRLKSLECINYVLELEPTPAALEVHMNDYLLALSSLTQDPNRDVRKAVCTGIARLTAARIDVVMPHIDSVVDFMLLTMKDPDEVIKLEACEFWSELAYYPMVAQSCLLPKFPQLIPLLLESMVYSESELMMIGGEEENDASVPDRPEDIKPQFSKIRATEEDSDDEDNTALAEYSDMWTVRKSAAAALDKLSQQLPHRILPIILPLLDQQLASDNWLFRETGVLALGAIAEGCATEIAEHLPKLLPFLIALTKDQNFMIRFVSCWSLSRYTTWVCSVHQTQKPGDGLVSQVVEALCNALADRNKKVQHAACSALSVFLEEAGDVVTPLALPIVQSMVGAWRMYQQNNRVSLLDSIATLFESCGAEIAQPEVLNVILPELWSKWTATEDGSQELFALMECFGCVVKAVGPAFAEFVEPVFARCVGLVEGAVISILAAKEEGIPTESVERDFLISAVELIDSIAEGIEGEFAKLMSPNFVTLVAQVIQDEDDEVKQVTFGLVGDMIKFAPEAVEPHLLKFLRVMAQEIYPVKHIHTSSNALWAIGELVISRPQIIQPYLSDVLTPAVLVLITDNMEKSLVENSATAIGRVALLDAKLVADRFPEFFVKWCNVVQNQQASTEKFQSVQGICKSVLAKPATVESHFGYLCVLILRWPLQKGSPEVQFFRDFLIQLRSLCEPKRKWQPMMKSLPPQLRQDIEQLMTG